MYAELVNYLDGCSMRFFSLILSVTILTIGATASWSKETTRRTGGHIKTYKTTKKKVVKAPAAKQKYKSKAVQDFMDGKTNKLDGYDKF